MNEVEGTIEALDEETLNQLKQSAIEDTEIKETQNTNEDIQELDKSIQKPKKPRTEAQKNALKKAQETRRKNLALKKKQQEEMKQAIADNEGVEPPSVAQENIQPVKRTRKPRPAKKPVVVYEDDYSSDEEVIVVKRKPKRKKPKKKIVYEDASSSSSDEEVIKKPSKRLQKSKRKPEPETESSDEDSDYGYDKEYSYPINRPLKYSDVFRFQ